MYVAALILVVPISLFLININHWYYLRRAIEKHRTYVNGIPNNVDQVAKDAGRDAGNWIVAHQIEIKRRVERVVEGPWRTYMEPIGLGYGQQQVANVLDNLLLHDMEVLTLARQTIEMAKGHYMVQAKRSLSPLYWLEVIIFLPKTLVSASGVDVSSKLADIGVKIAQITYWLVLAALAVVGFAL